MRMALRRLDDPDQVEDGLVPATLAHGAYIKLRRDIIRGDHRPGAKLRVEHLKDRYQVGAGTLREALGLLVADALVVVHGQRGFRVAAISLEDFRDLTETRVLLETSCLDESIRFGDDDWEAALLGAFHRLSKLEERLAGPAPPDFAEYEDKNRLFHETLISAAPTRWRHHFISILFQQSERYRRLSGTYRPAPRDAHAEHQAIFDAAMARDSARACALLAGHIRQTWEHVRLLPPTFFDHPYPDNDAGPRDT